MSQPLRVAPRLLPGPLAAQYLGVSSSTLRKLPIPRKESGAKRLYDVRDLDDYADALPYEAGSGQNVDNAPRIGQPAPKRWVTR